MRDTRNIVLHDYYLFKEQQEKLRRERIRHAARVNPDLSWGLLAERFNEREEVIKGICKGIWRDRDLFSVWAGKNPRRRRGRHGCPATPLRVRVEHE